MGNNIRQPHFYSITQHYRQQDWVKITEGQRQLRRHLHTRQTVQVYQLEGMPSQQDMEVYEWRAWQDHMVLVSHIILPSEGFCTPINSTKIMIQCMPLRLNQCKNLTKEEAITVLLSALKGFMTLQKRFGPVMPSQQLVAFNEWGRTKVWLNRDFGRNKIQQSQVSTQTSQIVRAQTLFRLVQANCRQDIMPTNLKKVLVDYNQTYQSIFSFLQSYAQSFKLNKRKYINVKAIIDNKDKKQQLNTTMANTHAQGFGLHSQAQTRLSAPSLYFSPHSIKIVSPIQPSLIDHRTLKKSSSMCSLSSISINRYPIDKMHSTFAPLQQFRKKHVLSISSCRSTMPSNAIRSSLTKNIILTRQSRERLSFTSNSVRQSLVQEYRSPVLAQKLSQEDQCSPKKSVIQVQVEDSRQVEWPVQPVRINSQVIQQEINHESVQCLQEYQIVQDSEDKQSQIQKLQNQKQEYTEKLKEKAQQQQTYEILVRSPQLTLLTFESCPSDRYAKPPSEQKQQIQQKKHFEQIQQQQNLIENQDTISKEQKSEQNANKIIEESPISIKEAKKVQINEQVVDSKEISSARPPSQQSLQKINRGSAQRLSSRLKQKQIQMYIRKKYNLQQKTPQIKDQSITDFKVQTMSSIQFAPQDFYSQRNAAKDSGSSARHRRTLENYHQQVAQQNRQISFKTPRVIDVSQALEEQDFLDVNFLDRSLQKRYSPHSTIKHKRKSQEEDMLNIASLQAGLLKFQQSKLKSRKQQTQGSNQRSPQQDVSEFQQPAQQIKLFKVFQQKHEQTTPNSPSFKQHNVTDYSANLEVTFAKKDHVRFTQSQVKISNQPLFSIKQHISPGFPIQVPCRGLIQHHYRGSTYVSSKNTYTPVSKVAVKQSHKRMTHQHVPQTAGKTVRKVSYDDLRQILRE